MTLKLYTSHDCTGPFYPVDATTTSLPNDWNDKTLSCSVDAGETYVLWTDTSFHGDSYTVQEGQHTYDELLNQGNMIHKSGAGRISSVQLVSTVTNQFSQITLYKTPDCSGNEGHVLTSDTTTMPSGWNDATLSCVVEGLPWIVYENDNYGGSAAAIGPGRHTYDDLMRMNMVHSGNKGRISSLRSIAAAPQAYWMAHVNGLHVLSDLTIPGTHDSGTYSGSVTAFSKCQSMGIREQLIAGIRYLDIRCKLWGDHLNDPNAIFKIFHGIEDVSLDFQEVLDDCMDFLQACPGECIVMSIKNDSPDSSNMQWFIKILGNYLGQNPNAWYRGTSLPLLGDVRGKIVLFRQFDLPSDEKADLWGLNADTGWGGANGKERTNFTIDNGSWKLIGQDAYELFCDENGMILIQPKLDAINNLLNSAKANPPNPNNQTLYVNYTSGVVNLGFPKDAADLINPELVQTLTTSGLSSRYGIVAMDYPDEAIGLLLQCNSGLDNPILGFFPNAIQLQANNQQYIGIDPSTSHLVATSSNSDPSTVFKVEVKNASAGQIALLASNNMYVCAENGGGRELVANRGQVGDWETFTVVMVDSTKGQIGLRSHSGLYVQARNGGGSDVNAVAVWALPYETFKLSVPAPIRGKFPAKLALQASNGQYVRADSTQQGKLMANGKDSSGDATFTVTVVDSSSGKIALLASNNSYVCAENGGGREVIANRPKQSIWEHFVVYDLGNGNVALQTYDGHYVQAIGGGGNAVEAISAWSLPWETFRLVELA